MLLSNAASSASLFGGISIVQLDCLLQGIDMEGPANLLRDKHIEYIVQLGKADNTLGYHLTEHLRLNGIYWAVTCLALLKRIDALDRQQTINYVYSCWDSNLGGFGSHPSHDSHMLSTLSAIQVLAIHDAIEESGIDTDKVINCRWLLLA